jgi:hypothetical protein
MLIPMLISMIQRRFRSHGPVIMMIETAILGLAKIGQAAALNTSRNDHSLTKDEITAFVGKNADYYWTRWTPLIEGQDWTAFNWAAFFF